MDTFGILSKVKALPICAVIIAMTFLISGTVMCGFLLLACLLVWPFSRHYYRQLSYYFIYPVWSQLVFLIDWWAPSDVVLYMDEETEQLVGHEHAMVVMNHSYDIDFLVGWLVCERCALLAATKVYAKRSLSFVPIIGWIWRMAEIIFLDRNWQKDRSCIVNQVAEISQYFNPVWILLFPEGTRFTPTKHKESVEFAKMRGVTPLEHLLIPRTKGFVLSIQAIKESGYKIRAIYDTTIAFDTGPGTNAPTFRNVLKGLPVKAQLHVTRIPMEEVPTEETACEAWLHNLFAKKDRLLDEFQRNGTFRGRTVRFPRRVYTLINEVFWTSLVLGTIFFYLVYRASPLLTAVVVAVAGGVSFVLPHLLNVTVATKGSSYGKKSTAAATQPKDS
ncbi:1-acyl-sn-glycerol-3-phosphate acyltransferase gamma [Hypsibius exemplaris]|uniref:1-acyl-sn-glycerol-3-phosphate acyltransferase gamma n=1 Tax=Hypsibius exemplaris TaxID=2072580 RepID=A0A1W0WPT0_HYPEX|nr:1-acyl-sn-glycerol-3-phosphate acyltransferase gamma [Hypsibius exemplaris]